MSNLSIAMSQAAAAGRELDGAWDVSYASYDNVSFVVTAQEATPRGPFFKPDGTKMYVVGSTGLDIIEYDLSTAWDISTASYLQNKSVSAQDADPFGVFFKPDGTIMYICGSTNDRVYHYNLSTPWDLSTAAYNKAINVGTQDLTPRGIFFKPDGTRMYILGGSGADVNEYSLNSGPWNISTAVFLRLFYLGNEDTFVTSLSFKDDGTKMYVGGAGSDAINEYNLSTPWDVSTASFLQLFSVIAQVSPDPAGLFFKPDGTKMYITSANGDSIHQYTLLNQA